MQVIRTMVTSQSGTAVSYQRSRMQVTVSDKNRTNPSPATWPPRSGDFIQAQLFGHLIEGFRFSSGWDFVNDNGENNVSLDRQEVTAKEGIVEGLAASTSPLSHHENQFHCCWCLKCDHQNMHMKHLWWNWTSLHRRVCKCRHCASCSWPCRCTQVSVIYQCNQLYMMNEEKYREKVICTSNGVGVWCIARHVAAVQLIRVFQMWQALSLESSAWSSEGRRLKKFSHKGHSIPATLQDQMIDGNYDEKMYQISPIISFSHFYRTFVWYLFTRFTRLNELCL